MLKTTLIEVGDKNLTQDNKKIQEDDCDKKEIIQKSCKSQKTEGQKIVKSKK